MMDCPAENPFSPLKSRDGLYTNNVNETVQEHTCNFTKNGMCGRVSFVVNFLQVHPDAVEKIDLHL